MMRLLLSFVLVFLGGELELLADQVTLKSGETHEGFYQSEDEEGINFIKLNGERLKIPGEEVQSMEFSQSGVPACFTAANQKTCDVILASLTEDAFVIAEGKARRTVRSIPRAQVQSFEMTRIGDHQKIIPLLVPDKKTELRLTSGQKVICRVLEISEGSVTISDSSGEKRVIRESEIASAAVSLVNVPFKPLQLTNLYPGYAQFKAGRVLPGRAMMIGFAGLWTGFAFEYLQAANQNKKAKSDLTVSFFNNTSYFESFTRHQNNQKYLAVSAIMLYAFHWVDLYRHREEMGGVTLAPYASSSAALTMDRSMDVGFVFSIRY